MLGSTPVVFFRPSANLVCTTLPQSNPLQMSIPHCLHPKKTSLSTGHARHDDVSVHNVWTMTSPGTEQGSKQPHHLVFCRSLEEIIKLTLGFIECVRKKYTKEKKTHYAILYYAIKQRSHVYYQFVMTCTYLVPTVFR